MESGIIVTSLAIGAAIFVGLVIFWFFHGYLKRTLGPDASVQSVSASKKSNWEEKRQHPRVAISWPAVLETPDESTKVQLKDISLGGAFVVCDKPMSLREKFRLSIEAPGLEAFTLNTEVVWSNTNVPQDKVIYRGMGVKFVQNTDEDRQSLAYAITRHLQQDNFDKD